jgi:hypothetical protein
MNQNDLINGEGWMEDAIIYCNKNIYWHSVDKIAGVSTVQRHILQGK